MWYTQRFKSKWAIIIWIASALKTENQSPFDGKDFDIHLTGDGGGGGDVGGSEMASSQDLG